ncbi:energy-coupling factor transporter transmembrane component T family protein, partial [Aminipila sp.]|uniref:energy-coupling factor transporter transmembrane component T family protein n=1 Tax=Aminipila sp. TaxID=2060095 RepID=UPI0028967964
ESGNLINRAKSLIPLLVPLFISAFRIAQDLAMAMEARCYRGGEHRTRLHEMKMSGCDFTALLILALFLALIIFQSRIM